MKYSEAIENLITDDNMEEFHDLCSGTCTTGYDNDGSTGFEIFDNGVDLGQAAGSREIFYIDYDGCAFFFIADEGQTEEQLVEQLKKSLEDS